MTLRLAAGHVAALVIVWCLDLGTAHANSYSGTRVGLAPPDVNFIIITIDDLGPERWQQRRGPAGVATPGLDSLASAGVVMSNTYTQTVCGPTRSELWSGRYWTRSGYVSNDGSEFDTVAEPTIPKVIERNWPGHFVFGNAGEIGIGQHSNASGGDWREPGRLGFDWYAGTLGPFRDSYRDFDAFLMTATSTDDSDMTLVEAEATNTTEHSADEVTRRAQEFLARSDVLAGKNFVLGVGYYLTHFPTHTPPGGTCVGGDTEVCFQEMIAKVDSEISDLVSNIPAEIYAKTLIFIISDNGAALTQLDPTYTYTSGSGKGSLADDSARAIWLVTGGLVTNPGRTNSTAHHVVDVMATIRDYTNSWMPTGALPDVPNLDPDDRTTWGQDKRYNGQTPQFDGRSMRGAISENCSAGNQCPSANRAVFARPNSGSGPPPSPTSTMIAKRSDGYKYWMFGGAEYLYQISSLLGSEEQVDDLCVQAHPSNTLGDCSFLSGADLAAYNELKQEIRDHIRSTPVEALGEWSP